MPADIDLHGCTATEAVNLVRSWLQHYNKSKMSVVHFIVGKGKHSVNNDPIVKPAVIKWLQDAKYAVEEDDDNPGRLNVYLTQNGSTKESIKSKSNAVGRQCDSSPKSTKKEVIARGNKQKIENNRQRKKASINKRAF